MGEATLATWVREGCRGNAIAPAADLMLIGLGAVKLLDSKFLAIVILVNRDVKAAVWRERLTTDLGIPASQIGALRNGLESLKHRRGVVAVASTAGRHLMEVIAEWHRQGRLVLVIADGVRLSSDFFGGLPVEVQALLALQEGDCAPETQKENLISRGISDGRLVSEPFEKEDHIVLGRVVTLYVDLTPLEASMFASLDRYVDKSVHAVEPPKSDGRDWIDWKIRFAGTQWAREPRNQHCRPATAHPGGIGPAPGTERYL